ncbi:MAG TPA: SDR family oxidoreductase [Phycisphaerae bacterium]|nr:SDR family oxidoreductase [Phycisphaerae bacterium]HNU47118.1 SDR family oxidoreductase [Phycisphaerae bacterium]
MARVLVTGGAGFIGAHLVERLVADGHQVRVLDNFSTGRRSNLDAVRDRIELHEADLRDPAACDRACRDIEYVLHEAAVPSVPKSVAAPRDSHEANIDGTFNLLQAAVARKVRRVVYAASSSAYGEGTEGPKHEELCPGPLSPYAVQKLTGEHYLRAFCTCFGLETMSLRYFNVFGARQNPAGEYAAAIPAFATALLRGQSPTVFGDGEQTRDFTYIDNVVHANMLALQVPRTAGEVVNVATGQRVSVNAVIAQLNELLGTRIAARHVAPRPGDIRHSWADISAARRLLGYEPIVGFAEGLARALEYYRTLV